MPNLKRIGPAPQKGKILSLRTKFVLFISLIIIGVCSGLSWYFVQQQSEFMKNSLIKTGILLVRNLVHSSRYSLITQDTSSLKQLIEGTMAFKEVVYVVATGPQEDVLFKMTKGILTNAHELTRDADKPLYPEVALARKVFHVDSEGPVISPFTTRKENVELLTNRGKAGRIPTQVIKAGETLYDFALPVRRLSQDPTLLGPLSLEAQERSQELISDTTDAGQIYGVIQVGLTNAQMLKSLNNMVRNVIVFTIVTILLGIIATTILSNRIVTPLRRLAAIAKRIADGDLTASVTPRTRDEVGQLTTSINQMTEALRQREEAISIYVQTITKQVSQLSTLNQTGVAITSTLDIDMIFSSVLDLLSENLGFSRMVLMLYNPEKQNAYVARLAGFSQEMEERAKQVIIPIQDGDGVGADLLIRGKSILAQDINAFADRIYSPVFERCKQMGVTSFVAAPLKSQQRILGFVGADKGNERCIQEDLDLLTTIANSIAVAIDNASAYKELEQLTRTLEDRVQDRTRALEEANIRLQELDQLKSAFVSIVSHELRTPMTSIKGLIENMLDGLTGDLTERQSFYLNRVKHNMERLTRMINDLLDLSRIEAGHMELRLTAMSIQELVIDVVESFQEIVQDKSLTLKTHQEGELPTIQGDRDKLQQVLINLITNAIKFTDAGGEIRVECHLRADDRVQICVIDTGYGIPESDQRNIFERFYRGQSVSVEARGAGLGLAICKSLVELHGGQIWVESIPGEGSRFYMTIPVQPPTA